MARKDDKGWNDEPQGGATPKFDRSKDYSAYKKPTDIGGKVDKAWKENDGFSGKLPSGE
jgi:hypothetical protein